MLSKELEGLRETFAEHAHEGMWLDQEQIGALCAVLASCAEDARALEACEALPTFLRRARFMDNIVPLSGGRAADNVIPLRPRGPHPTRPGGHAA